LSPLLETGALITALFAGFLGSAHCFGMCGGIAAGLGNVAIAAKTGQLNRSGLISALLFNGGRICSYALLGALSAFILSGAGEVMNIPQWGMILRLLTAVMISLIGLQFLFNWQLLSGIERMGAKVWSLVLPFAVRASALPGGTGRLLLGLCWGLLPCGLVYSVLLTAAASESPAMGALVMGAFGLGTIPSMLGMSLAAPAIGAIFTDRWTRRLMGIAMILLAVLSVSLMVMVKKGHSHQQAATHFPTHTIASS
jgi:sulfite exporter TauE/SafE